MGTCSEVLTEPVECNCVFHKFLDLLKWIVSRPGNMAACRAQTKRASIAQMHLSQPSISYFNLHPKNLYVLNSLHAGFVCFRKYENIFTCYIVFVFHHWHGAGNWTPSPGKTRIFSFYIYNTMAADDLAMQGARASAAILLIWLSWNIPPSIPDGLTYWGPCYLQHEC